VVQFLIAGALIFALHALLNPARDERADLSNRIVLTEDDIRQLAVVWIAQGRPPPTSGEMQSLVAQKVSEEMLYREAIGLGLDKNDKIIKRRLAQKMDFLAEDVAALRAPSVTELKAWYFQHSQEFALPPRASFRHLYFSVDKRGQGARAAATEAITKLGSSQPDLPEAGALADRFMFQDFYGDRAPDQLAKEFGPDFARALFQLSPGRWAGPIQSGYGWHLVWIYTLAPGRVPAFEEVEPYVRNAWLEEQQREVKRKAFEAMRARYTVVTPLLGTEDLANVLRKLPLPQPVTPVVE
jgi:peptidyl-prolyl cis-trans isomerase C